MSPLNYVGDLEWNLHKQQQIVASLRCEWHIETTPHVFSEAGDLGKAVGSE